MKTRGTRGGLDTKNTEGDVNRREAGDSVEKRAGVEKTEAACKYNLERRVSQTVEQTSGVEDYNRKKLIADKTYLQTLRSVLEQHSQQLDPERFKETNVEDYYREKLHLCSKKDFREQHAGGNENVLGVFREGKIYIRDNNPEGIKHAVTHEVFHELSNKQRSVETKINEQGRAVVISREISGIRDYQVRQQLDGPDREWILKNVGLNEGITELYTLRELHSRGDATPLNAYTEQRRWAGKLEALAGKDAVADAYFGGNLVGLKNRVNELGNSSNCWDRLSEKIDAYHRNPWRTELKREIDDIFDSLVDTVSRKGQV